MTPLTRLSILVTGLVFLGVLTFCSAQNEQASEGQSEQPAALTGPYLGQEPPGAEPKLFAPGIVSTGMYERDLAITPDGDEIYFSVATGGYAAIVCVRLVDGRWTEPQIAPFSGRYLDMEPCLAPDGSRLMFLSNRPREGEEEVRGWQNQHIWAVDRTAEGWSEPYDVGEPVNSDRHNSFFPSLAADGTLYFTINGEEINAHLVRSRLVDGRYTEPEDLGPQVNAFDDVFNAYVSPDQSFIILIADGGEDSVGGYDYYVTFSTEDGTWTDPVNLGETVNTPDNETSPYVTPDGKYFFFAKSVRTSPEGYPERPLTYADLVALKDNAENGLADIYWVDAKIIADLRPRR